MALGKIKADTLEHSTAGSLDTQYVVNGSAKAWSRVDQTSGISLTSSLNVSSVTDTAVGKWRSNFSASMNDALYSWNTGSFSNRSVGADSDGNPPTTSYVEFETRVATSAAFNDVPYNCMSIRGDLA